MAGAGGSLINWSLQQSSWLRQRILSEGAEEWLALWPQTEKPVGVLSLSSDGRLVRWWHHRRGAQWRDWGALTGRARALAGHEGRAWLAIVGSFGVQIRSLESGAVLVEDSPAAAELECAAFAADGTLHMGGRDGSWRRWSADRIANAPGAPPARVIRAHEKPIRALAPHPRGECVVSAGGDHVLRVWEG